MTVDEYLESPWRTRLSYRLYRNPLVMFLFAPAFLFLVRNRFTRREARRRERRNVHWTNLGVAGVIALLVATVGIKAYLMVQAPITLIGVRSLCGCSTCNTSSRSSTGNATTSGSTFRRRSKEAPLQAAQDLAVVHGQHRLPPHSSSEPAHTELLLAEMPRREPEPGGDHSDHTAHQLAIRWGFRLWDEDRRRMVGFGYLREYKRAAR